MKKLISLISIAALTGCVGPRTSGVWIEKGRLHIEDPAFAANIETEKDIVRKTAEGFLQVQVFVKNTNRQDFKCQYRFEWKDADGMVQKHASAPWRPLVMHGRDVSPVEGVSPLQGSVDFRLAIRRADW